MLNKYYYIKSDVELKRVINYPSQLRFLSVNIIDNTSDYKKITRQYYINSIGYEILLLIDGQRTLDNIIHIEMAKYNSDYDDTKNKIETFFKSMSCNYNIELGMQDQSIYRPVREIMLDNIYPLTASLELTHKCNLRCLHCYGNFGSGDEMPKQQVLTLLDDLEKVGVKNLELTGGDISVYPYLNDILKKAFSLKFNSVVLLTNGINMNKEFIDLVIKNSNRAYLQIDIHSLNEEYLKWFTGINNFTQKIIHNLKILLENNVKIRIVSMITKKNIDELPDIAKMVHELGIKVYMPSIVVNLGRAKQNKDLLLQNNSDKENYIKNLNIIEEKFPGLLNQFHVEGYRNNCGCITTNVVIDPLGNIKLCPMDDHYLTGLGNVFRENIKDIYDKNKDFIKELFYLNFPTLNSEDCLDCPNKLFCSYCFVRAFSKNEELRQKCNWYKCNISNKLIENYLNIK